MLQLFVLYDADCGLCRRLASWLAEQSALIPLTPIPAQSEQASKLYPNGKGKELAVVSDEGAVWLGDRAWIMCLYALRHYRHWARKLASPLLQPLARQAFVSLSNHRKKISEFMTDRELADQLRVAAPAPSCSRDA